MTSVERHRSTHHLLSDGRTESHNYNPSPRKLQRRIPPAVPSPPRLRSPSPVTARERSRSAEMMDEYEGDQWFFTEAELASSPSIIDGVSPIDERCRRAKGVNFIIQAGIMLKLPQLTLATASVFFHRYFMRVSMVPEKGGQHHYVRPSPASSSPSALNTVPTVWRLPRSKSHKNLHESQSLTSAPSLEQNIAATALFLASKTEENCRKTKEIVIAVAKVAQKNASLLIDEQSKEYWKWRDNLLTFEEHMLEMITFDVVLKTPYKYLWTFLQQLRIEHSKERRDHAWSFLNDSCLTPVCLLLTPRDIAITAIYFSAKISKQPIEDDEQGRPWWEQLDGSIERIAKGLNAMNDFYTENPLNRADNPWTLSPLRDDMDIDKTRKKRQDRSGDQTPSPAGRRNSNASQNGHGQENGVNGTKSEAHIKEEVHVKHESKSRSPVKPQDVPAPTTEGDNATELPVIPKIEEPSGSSDTALKDAANDPATHEHTNTGDGLAADLIASAAGSPKISPKRKLRDEEDEETSGRASKRVKSDEEGEVKQ